MEVRGSQGLISLVQVRLRRTTHPKFDQAAVQTNDFQIMIVGGSH